ncbi:hypothetical protein LX36DRAFT_59906 [Colletotrichum falcatum]|nr:hypothetical protein LX36DRAFT_59906 [Colletotrichum falcatum]
MTWGDLAGSGRGQNPCAGGKGGPKERLRGTTRRDISVPSNSVFFGKHARQSQNLAWRVSPTRLCSEKPGYEGRESSRKSLVGSVKNRLREDGSSMLTGDWANDMHDLALRIEHNPSLSLSPIPSHPSLAPNHHRPLASKREREKKKGHQSGLWRELVLPD